MALRATHSGIRDALKPVLALIRMYPSRFIAVAVVVFLLNFAENAAGFFGPKYFQDEHGWTPGQFAMMGFFGGFLGIFGSAYAGRLSDRYGRRPIAIILFASSRLLEYSPMPLIVSTRA